MKGKRCVGRSWIATGPRVSYIQMSGKYPAALFDKSLTVSGRGYRRWHPGHTPAACLAHNQRLDACFIDRRVIRDLAETLRKAINSPILGLYHDTRDDFP